MNLRFYVLCTAALLTLGVPALFTLGVPFLADTNITATIHGATYAGDTLELLNDTIIGINSNPPQSIVAKNGIYSFDLGPGDYIITARNYRNDTLIYSKQTTLKIEDEGNYVFDLLLYPVSENSVTEKLGDKTSNINSVSSTKKAMTNSFIETHLFTNTNFSIISYLPVALMLFLLGGGYTLSRKYKMRKRNKSQAETFNMPGFLAKILGKTSVSKMKPKFKNVEETASITESLTESESAENSDVETAALKKLPLSTELSEILDVIRGYKGRITQKELRSRLEYSEVKVSLLLSELEKRGLIKKFKHGRENIVTLTDEEH